MLKIQRILSLYTVSAVFGCEILMCYLAIPTVGILSATATYNGNCYGFSDKPSLCSWINYALNQSYWMMLLLTVPNFFVGFTFDAVFSLALFRSLWLRLVNTSHAWLPLMLGGSIALLGGLFCAIIVVAIPFNIIIFLGTFGEH